MAFVVADHAVEEDVAEAAQRRTQADEPLAHVGEHAAVPVPRVVGAGDGRLDFAPQGVPDTLQLGDRLWDGRAATGRRR